MIEIKNAQLTNDTVQALNKLISLDMNASSAFKLSRILKELSSLLELKISIEKRIMEKYAVKNEDGTMALSKDDAGNEIKGSVRISDMQAFTQEMDGFLSASNDINLEKLDFEKLGINDSVFTTKDMLKIEFLFI